MRKSLLRDNNFLVVVKHIEENETLKGMDRAPDKNYNLILLFEIISVNVEIAWSRSDVSVTSGKIFPTRN